MIILNVVRFFLRDSFKNVVGNYFSVASIVTVQTPEEVPLSCPLVHCRYELLPSLNNKI